MRALPTASLVAIALLLSACSMDPRKNYYGPIGDGYISSEVAPGLHRLEVKTDGGSDPEERARSLWRGRAAELCAKASYRDVAVQETGGPSSLVTTSVTQQVYQGPGPYLAGRILESMSLPPQNNYRRGYVVCTSSGLTDEQVLDLLKQRS